MPQDTEQHDAGQHTEEELHQPSRLSDRVIAVVVLGLGAALLVIAFNFPAPGQPEDPGTAALPQLIGVALLLLGTLLLFNAERNVIAPQRGTRLRTALMVIAGIGYTMALAPLGFVLSTLIFMLLGLLIMGVRSVSRLIAVPVLVTLAVHYLFTAALSVYLPAGLIEGVLP